MSRRRTAIVTAGLAAGAVASGLAGRAMLSRHRRIDPEALADLSVLPPEDLGSVTSFDGTELSVRAAGDPSHPVLVFVHGFSLDMTTWHYQWTALSDRYRCVLFDLRSHGRSARAASGDLSPSAFARDLAAVLDAVVPERRAGHRAQHGRDVDPGCRAGPAGPVRRSGGWGGVRRDGVLGSARRRDGVGHRAPASAARVAAARPPNASNRRPPVRGVEPGD